MTKGKLDKAFAGGALPPTIEKAQRATKWQTKQAHHQADRQRTLARRGLVVVHERDDGDSDEAAAWNGYLSYANSLGCDADRGWRGNGPGDAA